MSVVDRAREAGEALSEVRLKANADAARAVRVVEERLEEALGPGGRFDAMPNLAPHLRGAQAFKGLRVNNAASRKGPAEHLPQDGRAVMVLTAFGKLVYASSGESGVETWPVQDHQIQADLLRPFVEAARQALDEHVLRLDRRLAEHRAVIELARRVEEVLGPRIL